MVREESRLATLLRERLRPNFKAVFTNVNLGSRKLYPYWQKWHGSLAPPAQPDIDLLLVDSRLQMLAVELKYFKPKADRVNYPYYAGIDEALALLKFGFVVVSLWHCFEQGIPRAVIAKYVRGCRALIGSLDLPLVYSALYVVKEENQPKFREFLGDMSESDGLPTGYGRTNPLHGTWEVMKVENFLRTVLKIPTAT